MNNIVIFCDFDGTITINDTVDHLLSIFADKNWITIEESWKNGEIGSKECLKKQFDCIDYIFDDSNFYYPKEATHQEMIDFIESLSVEQFKLIEEYFAKLPKV